MGTAVGSSSPQASGKPPRPSSDQAAAAEVSDGQADTASAQQEEGSSQRAVSPSDATTEDWGLTVLVAIGEKWIKPLSQVLCDFYI